MAQVVDAVEAELDAMVAGVEDRIMARMQATNGEPSAALQEALHRGVSAGVRDALARLRLKSELPQELPPDLLELARLFAESGWELAGLADAALAGQDVFWDRFQVIAERTLDDRALCWEVVKAARVRLSGNPAQLTRLFHTACEHEVSRTTGIDEDARLRAVLRALDGQWVDRGELGYDLASHHVAVVADTPPLLDAVARRTRRQLLGVKAPDGRIWGWIGGRTRLSDSDLDALVASQGSAKARVAFGGRPKGSPASRSVTARRLKRKRSRSRPTRLRSASPTSAS